MVRPHSCVPVWCLTWNAHRFRSIPTTVAARAMIATMTAYTLNLRSNSSLACLLCSEIHANPSGSDGNIRTASSRPAICTSLCDWTNAKTLSLCRHVEIHGATAINGRQSTSRPHLSNSDFKAIINRSARFSVGVAMRSNDPSSATRRTGGNACQPRHHAGFAAAHG